MASFIAALSLLLLALLYPPISAGVPFSPESESSERDEAVSERYRREEVFESSASGEPEPPAPPDEILNCTRSLSAPPFTLIASSLDSLVRSCSNTTSQTSESYNFTITTASSLSPFETFSGESSTVFADHFKIGEDYTLSIVSNCSSVSTCSYSKVSIFLSLSVLNHTSRLLPFGRSPLLDEELTDVDDEAGTMVAGGNKPIPVFDGRYEKIYISSNGIVSFTRPYINWQPIPFPYSQTLIPVLAPLWIDFDIQSSENSALFYNIYTSTGGLRDQNMLKIASERVRALSGEEFQGSWVLIATWSNVIPYTSNNTQTSATFQLVLLSDYTSTYSIYIYNNTSSLSTTSLNSVVGYTAADFINFQNVNYANPSTLDATLGNTGIAVGQWLYNLSPATITGSQAEESCLQWVRGQELLSNDWLGDIPLSCPCSLSQATSDWRFNFDNSSRTNCAIAVVTRSQHGLECCYDTSGSLLVDTEASGSYHYYHSLFYPEEHLISDSRPFQDCCVESNNCVLYYKYRPSSNCDEYQPPTPGFIWGDPHLETFDGNTYTFNGVGEYQLIQSLVQGLTVQTRLQAYTGNNATVLTAVAIRSVSSQLVQFELNSLGSFVLYVGNSEHRDIPREGEYLVVTETGTHDNTHLSSADPSDINNIYIQNTGDSMLVSTGSGAVLNIGKQGGFLYMGVELGPEFSGTTRGLLGYYDGVNNNDYVLPNGSVLSNGLNEEQMYYNFGLKWQASETQSIFHYHSQYTYELYNTLTTPTFGLVLLESNPALNATAVATCGTDYGCLYDISITGDVNLGHSTLVIRQSNQKIREDLVNFPPVIIGDKTITVTVGDTPTTVQYTGEDPNTNNETIIRIKDPVPAGIQLNSSGHLLIDISSLPSTPLYMTSTDSTNITTLQRLSILLCKCSNNGSCSNDLSDLPLNNNGHARLLCSCPHGFAGDYCETDMRGCLHNEPCPTYTSCVAGSDEYSCTNCASGFTVDADNKCIDINECIANTNNCSQVCVNNDGGFTCSCKEGYRLANDRISCEDIDECSERTDDCEQICINTPGSYECSCIYGWTPLNSNNCIQAGTCGGSDGLSLCGSVSNGAGCSIILGGLICSCVNGYYFDDPYCLACNTSVGDYGFDCNRTCDCQNNGTCDGTIGCVCTDGWTGHDCTTEINLSSPSFSSTTLSTLSLSRLLPSDTPILTISATDPDSRNTGHVTYHMTQSPHALPPNTSDGVTIFRINNETGVITSLKPLFPQPFHTYLLHIEARDGGLSPKSTTHMIVVTITDVPLPSPILTSPGVTLTISENKPPGAKIANINCTEINTISSEFTELSLGILHGNTNNTFAINGSRLVTAVPIDFEEFQSFSLNISCTNSFSATVTLLETVIVLNLNDNPFLFSSPSYSVSVYENITNGYELLTVVAADADQVGAMVHYNVTNPNLYGGLFKIDYFTGVISASSALPLPFDRESRDNYTFNVTARIYHDNDSFIESTQATINVLILDVNDFTPLFTKSLYTSNNLSQINAFPDTALFVSAFDRDLSQNGQITYSIQSNPHFDINSITGEVYVTTAAISKGNYLLQVNATDNGTSPLIGSTLIDIFVRATPEELLFTHRQYHFNVYEDEGSGSTIGHIKATLYDIFNVSIEEGSAAESIEYRILGSDPFYITAAGNVISTAGLDYENQSQYYLPVTATLADFSSIAVATATISVSLIDVNDHHPVFQPSSYSVAIYEDLELGADIIQVYASDADQNGLQSLAYSIEEEGPDIPFSINPSTGIISLASTLTTAQGYHFVVIATDIGLEPALISTAAIHVSVSRRQAVKPVLNSTLYIFTLPEMLSANIPYTIGTVGGIIEGNRSISTDTDGVAYRLKEPSFSPSVSTPFTIDTHSGDVNVSAMYDFDHESRDQFILYVELYSTTDNETIYDTSPIIVNLIDENDHAPIFTSAPNQVVIPLTTPPDTPILTVTATDEDSGSNGGIVYYLDSARLGFHVDRHTGVITTTNSTLISGDYHMTVTASDRGSPPRDNSVNITVSILQNLSPFINFTQNFYSFSIPEHSLPPLLVGTVTINEVINQTFGTNDISFSFRSPHSCFDINSSTGSITLTCSIDGELIPFHDLVVVGTAPNGLMAEVGVRVNISDINDHPPSFDRDTYTVVIYSNYNDTNVILTPSVSDLDQGMNRISRFSIVDSSISNLIDIDPNSGQISLISINGSLPQGDYRFTIKASDSLNTSLSSTAVVLLSIIEPSPKILEFSPSSLVFSVPENSPGGTVIGVLELITPHSLDPAEYLGNLQFEILSGDNIDYFHIVDSNATLILVNNLLDREEIESHVVLVRASFIDYKVSTSSFITVSVSDVNDNSPLFNQTVYASTVDTMSPVGSYITTVHAIDDDIGMNALVIYSLLNTTDYFYVNSTTGVVSTLSSSIPEDHYKLIVIGTDSGTNSLSSTSIVSVIVETPVPDFISFQSTSYSFIFDENTPAGYYLGNMAITQVSSALNGLLYTFIEPSDSALAANLADFHLDPLTGNLSTLSLIDRESFSGGQFIVKAYLPSVQSLSATATVTLTVNDENDNTPLFDEGLYTKTVTEGSISNPLLTVSADDADTGSNAQIQYFITGSDFTIDSTGALRASDTGMDSGIYTATITAKDGGSPSLTGTATLLVTVYASLPSGIGFTKSSYSVQRNESITTGTECGSVLLKPIDMDHINYIQYTISGTSNFVIIKRPNESQLQAWLHSSSTFDYESTTSYSFTVTASITFTNTSISSASTSTSYTVSITDVNDNVPVFQGLLVDHGYYEGSVTENSGSNVNVCDDVSASDQDGAAINSQITYSLQNTFNNRFKINPSSGLIRTGSTNIDRETNDHFVLIVVATDGGNPPLSSTAQVLVTVGDVNDNDPVLQSNNGFNYYFNEEQKSGVTLFTVSAIDVDSSSELTYSRVEGSNKFNINSNGQVSSTEQLDSDSGPSQYIIEIRVSDGERSAKANLTLHLVNVPNDNRPQFVNFPDSIRIKPNPDSNDIAYFHAIDSDNDGLSYSIEGGQYINLFSMNSNTGLLSKNTADSLPPGEDISVNVVVTDDSQYTLSTTQTCILVVLKELHFVKEIYSFEVPENTSTNSMIAYLEISTSLLPTFSFTANNQYFLLQSQLGRVNILLKERLDYEDPFHRTMSFSVVASLSGHVNSTTTVTVIVTDVNDNAPVFTGTSTLTASIDASVIGTINATDADSPGNNSRITYRLLTNDDFLIDRNTGVLRRSRPLEIGVKQVTVFAEDGGSPPMLSSRDYTVHVEGVSAGDGGAVASYAIVGIMSIILIILIVAVLILGVSLYRKRRERVKNDRDPYLDNDNENWQLGVSNRNDNKNKKGKDFEMQSKTADDPQIDASAFMFGDDFLDPKSLPWSDPRYRDKESETEFPATDDEASDIINTSLSTDNRQSMTELIQAERRLSKAGSQKDTPAGPISRRGRRLSEEGAGSGSDLDTEGYLKEYQDTSIMKPGERPSEYDIFIKPDPNAKPARPSLRNALWPHSSNQPSIPPFLRDSSSTRL